MCRSIVFNSTPVFVDVIQETDAQINECFPNIVRKIDRDGGAIEYGGKIWEWPNILIEAEFHSVWIAPDGTYIDITPKIYGRKEPYSFPIKQELTMAYKLIMCEFHYEKIESSKIL